MAIIPAKFTRVGRPQHHAEIINGMNDVLIANGVELWPTRRKMIAHHIIACGWAQNCWWYNGWGVRKGSWKKDTYIKPTKEDDGTGKLIDDKTAQWRAFGSWGEALDDYFGRINSHSKWNPDYATGAELLHDPEGDDRQFWLALVKGGYATDTKNFADGKGFASICRRVEKTILPEKKKTLTTV